jgi:Holliday junction resolvase RusA-like endonuclease
MSMMLEFEVPGAPKPHPRPRAYSRGGHAAMYTPKPAQDRKYNIQQYAKRAMEGYPPWAGPVSAELTFIMPRPAAMNWKRRPTPRVHHIKKNADCDNLAKGVLDSMNGVVYLDDCQVWCLIVTKWIAAGGEAPRIIIRLELLEP